ncbi:MAG: ankyrin repeat domain-containing protein [Candidatus Babeliales bacterium]
MNNIKKVFFLIWFSLSIFYNYGIKVGGEIDITQIADISFSDFELLPPELKQKIILQVVAISEDLNETLKNLHAIVRVDKDLRDWVNDPITIQKVINILKEKDEKNIAQRTKEDWQYALSLISLPGARAWLQENINEKNINKVVSDIINNARNFNEALKNLHYLTRINEQLDSLINNQETIHTIIITFQNKIRKEEIPPAPEWELALFLSSLLSGAKHWLQNKIQEEKITLDKIFEHTMIIYKLRDFMTTLFHLDEANAIPLLPNIINTYLALGGNINATDSQGNTFLIYAVSSNDENMIKYLLSNPNININVKNNEKKSALDIAQDNENIIKILNEYKK